MKWLIENVNNDLLTVLMVAVAIIIFYIGYKMGQGKSATKAQPTQVLTTTPVVVQEAPQSYRAQDDLELVAVITAALAASLNTSADRLMVTSLRRVNGVRSLRS